MTEMFVQPRFAKMRAVAMPERPPLTITASPSLGASLAFRVKIELDMARRGSAPVDDAKRYSGF